MLFITCADSRIDPNLVTQSRPGELFIVRNVGNIVPRHYAIKDKNSVAATIEFAVLGLKVKDIIICGHSNCGAMKAVMGNEEDFADMPHLWQWLQLAMPVRRIVEEFYPKASGKSSAQVIEEQYTGAVAEYPDVSFCCRRPAVRPASSALLVL